MESKQLKKLGRRLRIKENSRFNFGKGKDGNIITSTSNPKAHSFNKLMRESNAIKEANIQKMVEAFERGEVAEPQPKKISKGCKSSLFKQSIKNANDTREFIKKVAEYLSETSGDYRTIQLIKSKI